MSHFNAVSLEVSAGLALTWSPLLPTFLGWAGHSSPHLPGPLYHTHGAPPSSRSCPFPSHREAFKVPSPHGLLWASCLESSKRNQLQLLSVIQISCESIWRRDWLSMYILPPSTSSASHLTAASLASPPSSKSSQSQNISSIISRFHKCRNIWARIYKTSLQNVSTRIWKCLIYTRHLEIHVSD